MSSAARKLRRRHDLDGIHAAVQAWDGPTRAWYYKTAREMIAGGTPKAAAKRKAYRKIKAFLAQHAGVQAKSDATPGGGVDTPAPPSSA